MLMSKLPAAEQIEKICLHCKLLLSTDSFYKQKAYNKDKVYDCWDSCCKSCRLKYSIARRREIKLKAIEYLGGKCVDCGECRPISAIYDFHHKDPTLKDFSIGKNTLKFESITKELDKCELLCSNCHRIRHYELI
jgi:hypothetical protein